MANSSNDNSGSGSGSGSLSGTDLYRIYENSEIFVTGGSGVVGKALIEKLLRSVNVRRIYVLLRPRKQLTAEERLVRLRQANVFEVLCAEQPLQLLKLVAVPGDVTLPLLGISPADMQRMASVSLVYHCAATVRFDEPLRVALRLNLAGTLEALKFAETLKQLRVFVHVSTFYSNPYLEHVEPKYYGSPISWRKGLQLLDQLQDDELINSLTSKIIVGFPNTYTFTKNLAESLVNDYRTRLPVIVYRPSIVLFSINDPVPGYAPSLVGAMGLFTLVGAGMLKTVYMGDNICLDITPQDLGIKALLYYTNRGLEIYQQGTPAELPVFQSSSCTHMPQTFNKLANQMDSENLWFGAAFEKNILIPSCTYTSSRWLYEFIVITKQVVPALLLDLIIRLCGHKPMLMGVVRRAYGTLYVMRPFLFNTYTSPGTTEIKQMLARTKGTHFDVREFDYAADNNLLLHSCRNMLLSIRKHLLNEHPSTLERSKRLLRIKIHIFNAIRLLLLYKLLVWLWSRVTL